MNTLPRQTTRRSLANWAFTGVAMNMVRGRFSMTAPSKRPDNTTELPRATIQSWVTATTRSVLEFHMIVDSRKHRRRQSPLRILKSDAKVLKRSDWETALGGQPIFVRLRFTPELALSAFGIEINNRQTLVLSGSFHFGIEVEGRGKKRKFLGPNGLFENIRDIEMTSGLGLLVRLDPAAPPGALSVVSK